MDQTGSRPPDSEHNLFFWCKFGIGKCFGATCQSNSTELIITSCCVKRTFVARHNLIKTWFVVAAWNKRRWYFKMMIFFIFQSARESRTYDLFHLSNFLQMLNDHRMVNDEFFGNFSCSCKRVSFDDPLSCCQLPMAGHYAPHLQGSSSALQNFLNHHYTVLSLAATEPKELLMLQVISTVLQPILNLN